MIKCLYTVRVQLKLADFLAASLSFGLFPIENVLHMHVSLLLSLFLSPVFVLLSLSHLGGCPLNRPLHIGGRTSPLPRVW